MAVRPLQFQAKNQKQNTSVFALLKQDKIEARKAAQAAANDRRRKVQLLNDVRTKLVKVEHEHDDYRLLQEILEHPRNRIVENNMGKFSFFAWEK
jgi:hypothetical protein